MVRTERYQEWRKKRKERKMWVEETRRKRRMRKGKDGSKCLRLLQELGIGIDEVENRGETWAIWDIQ